jgi:Ca2+-binding EF-hand superfamily protein
MAMCWQRWAVLLPAASSGTLQPATAGTIAVVIGVIVVKAITTVAARTAVVRNATGVINVVGERRLLHPETYKEIDMKSNILLAGSRAALAMALIGAASVACAQTPTNVSDQEEAASKAFIVTGFNKIDTNHDGNISLQEWDAYMTKYLAKQRAEFDETFKAADKNHDGKLSRAEAAAANPLLAKYFNQIDTNHDGYLTPDEIRAAILAHRQASMDVDSDDSK